jgi:hypothetical protein
MGKKKRLYLKHFQSTYDDNKEAYKVLYREIKQEAIKKKSTAGSKQCEYIGNFKGDILKSKEWRTIDTLKHLQATKLI